MKNDADSECLGFSKAEAVNIAELTFNQLSYLDRKLILMPHRVEIPGLKKKFICYSLEDIKVLISLGLLYKVIPSHDAIALLPRLREVISIHSGAFRIVVFNEFVRASSSEFRNMGAFFKTLLAENEEDIVRGRLIILPNINEILKNKIAEMGLGDRVKNNLF